MDNQTRRILLERVKASGFPGSIIDVFKNPVILDDYIAQQQNQQQQPIVAQTPQEQEQGLRPFHQQGQVNQSMAFPNVQPNQSFNTVGMKIPIDINKYNNQGHLVESYKAVPPGITNLPTGPNQGTIIESPARMQKGGVKKYQTGGPYNPFQYAVTDPERMRTMLQFPGQYVAPTVDIVDKSQFVPMSVPGVSGSMKTVYVNPKTKDRYETPQTTKAQLASSDIARSNNVDPIGMGILAASTGAPLIRTAANALPYLNAPLTIGGRVFPAVTAGNALMAAGAANSTEQILNPNSELRTNPDAYNIGMTGLGYAGLGIGKGLYQGAKQAGKYFKPTSVSSSVDDVGRGFKSDVGSIDYRKNPLSDKEREMDQWFNEQMRFDKLPQTTNKQSIEVLDNFKQRIRTPEGQKRLKELGITEEQLLQDLKIVEDPNTYGYYKSAKNTIAMNPNHPLPKKVVRHEIEHGVQNALRQSKINKIIDAAFDESTGKFLEAPAEKLKALESTTTEIDDILSGLTLRREGTPDKKWTRKVVSDKPIQIDDYKALINNKQNATDYFLTGSDGAEKSAFLGEVQQYMMDTGKIPKGSYVQITPEMVKETMVDAMFDEAGGGKYLRLFNIIKADPKNYEIISKGLNKMLSITPYIGIGGAGLLGAGALQQQEIKPKYIKGTFKQGGVKKYFVGGLKNRVLYNNSKYKK